MAPLLGLDVEDLADVLVDRVGSQTASRDPVWLGGRRRHPQLQRHELRAGIGVWTRDINKAHRTAHRLRAGTVWINCYSVFDAAMPFGGYQESGWGREMGHNALDNYLETKSVVTQLA